ncbi:MAG: redox-regulated ATPase YchF [Lachnospiraceae bacterium]|nr:redox-regulated ATPase YchF [Lachnospiraceae bacterium]MDY6221494.1 redox-regulated ATPase YchF [Candidatus Alectryocaccobium sp.]
MKLGIVGLPNVGKSTLFNAITGTANAQAANYPFCTIEPNTGIVAVPDERLDKLCEIWDPDKKTPAVVEFVDIAGLVKGASKGAGLGNKFLGHIRECDAIIHVVRCFDNENITHVVEDATKPAPVDPDGDIECIDLELIFSDLEMAQNRLAKFAKAAKTGNKEAKAEVAWLEPLIEHLENGQSARTFEFDEKDEAQQLALKELGLLSRKPIIYACNMDDDGAADPDLNEYYKIVKKRADIEGAEVIPICAKTEEELSELDADERAEFMEDLGMTESGLDRLIKASYSLLGLISFLTDGKKECRAWTIKRGTKAPQAAGKIHSDFEKGFIRAQVCSFDTLMECGGKMAEVKARGLYRSEGKEYVVKDGDIIEFLFNV